MRPTLVILVLLVAFSLAAQMSAPGQARAVAGYGKLPLAFEANHGQTDSQVKFLSRGAGYSLFLAANEAVLTLPEVPAARTRAAGAKALTSPGRSSEKSKSVVLRMKLVGANAKANVVGQDELPGKSNYFIGNDPKKWHTNVQQFAKVRYENVYPGVDLVYYGRQRELEYDFVLQPGANPDAIRLRIDGVGKLRLDRGDLVLTSAAGEVRLRRPQIYQEVNGSQQGVTGRYVMKSENEVAFELGVYDRRRAVVIDPVLAYSTYLGGSESDNGLGIALDGGGNAYVVGQTTSADFPTLDAIQPGFGGDYDVFVSKINPDGSALVYSTYLGGGMLDEGFAIAVDAAGHACVTGATFSADFPTVNAIQPTMHSATDGFVAKLKTDGTALVYSTYLGGSSDDYGAAIAASASGDVYVAGSSKSTDFQMSNALQVTNHGGNDIFVAKINPAGSTLVYSTYLGGAGHDYAGGIAVDSAGNAYVAGQTFSTDFPLANALQTANHGWSDVAVIKINAAGNALVYSTYLGGSIVDAPTAIAIDAAGNAYVTGSTDSTDFPTANALQSMNRGANDAFVSKINATGSTLVYSTYLGGSDLDFGRGIAVDAAGNAYVDGETYSNNFPVANAIQTTNRGASDVFLTKVNSAGSALVYSTYFGGISYDLGHGVAVDSAGTAYLIGSSYSKNFPVTPVAFQRSKKLSEHGVRLISDAFIAKIASQTFVNLSKQKVGFGKHSVGTTSNPKTVTLTNTGTATLTINRIYIAGANPGDFAQTSTCGPSLAAGASCTIKITFTPTATGARKAGLGISDSDPASPQAITLNGVGI